MNPFNELISKSFFLARPQWFPYAIAVGIVIAVLTLLSYRSSRMPGWAKLCSMALRMGGVGLLLLCLLEPMGSVERAKPQANMFAVVVDNSQSTREVWRNVGRMRNDPDEEQWYRSILSDKADWIRQLSNDFRVRRYLFDDSLDPIDSFEGIQQGAMESALVRSMLSIQERYPHRQTLNGDSTTTDQPLAGIILFSDGQATDKERLDAIKSMKTPIYPVLSGEVSPTKDLYITDATTRTSDFETAPVTITANASHQGFSGQTAVVDLLDDSGKAVESKTIALKEPGQPVPFEFRFRPAKTGIQGYRVVVRPTPSSTRNRQESDGKPKVDKVSEDALMNSSEFTIANNQRHQVVDRNRGPYKILYIAGRPNWEYKFLTRALAEDDEMRLTGLIRIAKKEPKFSFRDSKLDAANPLFSGFEDATDEEKEQFDEPVFVRLGLSEEGLLKKGFPKDLDELYAYDAIMIDDVEHSFFTLEQQSMIRQFVSLRGGGLMALGGQESMRGNDFRNSVISQLLPIYGEDGPFEKNEMTNDPNTETVASVRMELTRDGWLQPFMRLADTELNEKKRLEKMPGFQVWNRVKDIKPGAAILSQGIIEGEDPIPLLVTQRFGRGRTSAFLLGDWWRWAMRREDSDPVPLYQAWRQLARWLVTDVPKRIQVSSELVEGSQRVQNIMVDLRGNDFQVIDNGSVKLSIRKPDGIVLEQTAEASSEVPGRYISTVLSEIEGVYAVTAQCNAPDGSDLGTSQLGWVHDPLAKEFQSVGEDQAFLRELAEQTGGRVLLASELDSFASNVPSGSIPIREKRVYPLWHQSWVILLALATLCTEWGWRRRYGMS